MPARRSPRAAEQLVAAVAVVAAAVATVAPPSPTGRPVVDRVYLGLTVGAVTYAGAWAPWWVAAGAGLVAAVTVGHLLLAAVALFGVGVALWAGRQREARPEWLVVSIGLTTNVLARSHLDGFLGSSALVGVLVGLVVFLVGISYRPRTVRRTAWGLIAVILVMAGAATVAFGLAAADARSTVHNGQQAAEIGVGLVHQGDYAAAAEQLDAAAEWLGDGADALRGPLPAGAALIPVIAQHRAVAADLSAVAAEVSARLLTAIRQGGERPDCARVEAALATLRQAIDDTRSPWLVPEVVEELDSMTDQLGSRDGSAVC